MKKILLILAAFLLFQSHLIAQESGDEGNGSTSTPLSPWFMGTGLGAVIPSENFDPNFPLGGSALLFAGYRLDSHTALQLDLSPVFYTGGGDTLSDGRTFLNLRYSLPSKGYITYFLLGPGYDFQFNSGSWYNTASLAGDVGLGMQFDIHPGEHIFLEARYDVLLYQNVTQQDIPIFFGLMEDL
jgi:hypothetical protein